MGMATVKQNAHHHTGPTTDRPESTSRQLNSLTDMTLQTLLSLDQESMTRSARSIRLFYHQHHKEIWAFWLNSYGERMQNERLTGPLQVDLATKKPQSH